MALFSYSLSRLRKRVNLKPISFLQR